MLRITKVSDSNTKYTVEVELFGSIDVMCVDSAAHVRGVMFMDAEEITALADALEALRPEMDCVHAGGRYPDGQTFPGGILVGGLRMCKTKSICPYTRHGAATRCGEYAKVTVDG